MDKIMVVSTVTWYVFGGIIFLLFFVLSQIVMQDIFKLSFGAGAAISVFFMVAALSLFKKYTQRTVTIEIVDKETITILFNNKEKVSCPISELKKMNTISKENIKADVQAEIIFKNSKIDLFSALNTENKKQFDRFITYLEKEFRFTYKKAPFSLKWSKYYVEYQNPLYHE